MCLRSKVNAEEAEVTGEKCVRKTINISDGARGIKSTKLFSHSVLARNEIRKRCREDSNFIGDEVYRIIFRRTVVVIREARTVLSKTCIALSAQECGEDIRHPTLNHHFFFPLRMKQPQYSRALHDVDSSTPLICTQDGARGE